MSPSVRTRPVLRRIARTLLLVAALVFVASWVVARITSTPGRSPLVVRFADVLDEASDSGGQDDRGRLVFCSFNLAHCRNTGWSTMLEGPSAVDSVLSSLSAILRREGVDVCALQEADGPSWWTHDVNQVSELQDRLAFGYSAHSYHVEGLGLAYGTALLSRPEVIAAEKITFLRTEPTFTKGFTLATIRWPEDGREVDVVSTHLDFSRPWTRTAQLRRLRDLLRDRDRPLVLMGDFNTNWDGWLAKMKWLADELDLTGFQPESTEDSLVTMPLLGWRIDWILISSELRFESYKVLPDAISDHRAVVAEIAFH